MSDIDTAIKNIYTNYPRVRNWGIDIKDMRGSSGKHGKAEMFFTDDPGHPDNPNPYFGKNNTIELYANVSGRELENLILGDMLHLAPRVSPKFRELKAKFTATRTPAQKRMDERAYQRSVKEYGEMRPFEQWMQHTRDDAYIRGYLTPDRDDEWKGIYTPEQKKLLEQMRQLLKGNDMNSTDSVREKGRFGDNLLAHLSSGERVIPPRSEFPDAVNTAIDISLEALGLSPERYEAGSEQNSINPETGLPEFFIGDVVNLFGGSQEEKAAKQQKKFLNKSLVPALFGSAGVPTDGLFLSTSTASDPFGTGTYGPEGSFATLSPEMQDLFGQAYGQFDRSGEMLDMYTQGNLFSDQNPLYSALSNAANLQIQDELQDLRNLISSGWNRSGSNTGFTDRAADAVGLFDLSASQKHADVIRNTLAGAQSLQNIRANDLNNLINIGRLASPLTDQARNLASQLYGIEANKLGQYLGAQQDYRTLRGQVPTMASSLANIADQGLQFYAAGGGFDPGFSMFGSNAGPTKPFDWSGAFESMVPQQTSLKDLLGYS